jgi:hypothetical protein
MNRIARALSCLATAGWIGAVACGRVSDSPVAPTGEAPTASVQGTVESASGAAAGLRVSVAGTNVSSMTDTGGRFALQGVHRGDATLRFQGTGVDASLTVPVGGDTSLRVQVAGNQAVLRGGEI